MRRIDFLQRAVAGAASLVLGRDLEWLVPQPTPVPAPVNLAVPTSYVYLDSGSLDLGIVRDSLLESTDDWRMFAETFESAARVPAFGQSTFVTPYRDPHEVLEELRAVAPDEHALLTEHLVLT